MENKFDPAKSIIRRLHGAARIGRELSVPISTVCAWATESAGKGHIPRWHWDALKELAKKDGWVLDTLHLSGETELPKK